MRAARRVGDDADVTAEARELEGFRRMDRDQGSSMNLRKVRDVLKELRPAVQQSGARQFFDFGNEREAAELQRAGCCHMLML